MPQNTVLLLLVSEVNLLAVDLLVFQFHQSIQHYDLVHSFSLGYLFVHPC